MERQIGAKTAIGQSGPARTYSVRSLHGKVAHDLGARILGGALPPGAVLPNETLLSVELSVSRTALREAIKVLGAKGLVESRPKTGTRVRPRSEWNMLDPDILAWQFAATPIDRFTQNLFEVRRIIEPPAAALAATRGDEKAIAQIAAAFAELEAAGDDVEASIGPDLRFHQAILAATDNELLIPLGALIETALASGFRLSNRNTGARLMSVPRHRDVLRAIQAHDAEGARQAMVDLLDNAIEGVHRVIGIRPDGSGR